MPSQLVLLPGLDGTGKLFGAFSDAWGSKVGITIVDYSSPEVSTYADCLASAERSLPKHSPYVLVGESFSGPVAIKIAASRPTGLRGLVLAGSFCTSPRQILRWLSPLSPVLPTHGPHWAMDHLLLGRHGTLELSALMRDAMATVTPHAIRSRVREVARVNVSEDLAAIDVPILYLRAKEDRLVPKACGDEIARLGRHVEIAEVIAPHMLLQCAAPQCATLISGFAAACEGARAG